MDVRENARSNRDRRAAVVGWVVWTCVLVAAAVMVARGSKRTVTPNYAGAARAWIAGENLYRGTGKGFIYPPQSAILYTPFAVMPEPWGDILWRTLSLGVFAWGAYRISRVVGASRAGTLFLILSAAAAARVWPVVLNGQCTLLMGGCMMHAIADMRCERWSAATIWITVGFAVKPLILVLALLAAAMHRPVAWRLAVGAVAIVALPFVTQSPPYAWEQYMACGAAMKEVAAMGAQTDDWAHGFSLLRLIGVDMPERAETLVRIVAAIGVLGACLWMQRRRSSEVVAAGLLALAMCYLMLFNPRTENNTYALIAPAVGLFLGMAVLERRWIASTLLAAVLITMTGSFELGRILLPETPPHWLAPVGASVFTVYVFWATATAPTGISEGPADPARDPAKASSEAA